MADHEEHCQQHSGGSPGRKPDERQTVRSRDRSADRVHQAIRYEQRNGEVIRRYGRRLAKRTIAHLERIRRTLAVYGTVPTIAALKPW